MAIRPRHFLSRRFRLIFNKYSVLGIGTVAEYMYHRAHQFATPNNQDAAHECKANIGKIASLSPHQIGVGLTYDAASSMFSIKIPYPLVGSFTRTCVTAPTSLPS